MGRPSLIYIISHIHICEIMYTLQPPERPRLADGIEKKGMRRSHRHKHRFGLVVL